MSAGDRVQRRKHQIARNEALFREVNERLDEVSGGRSTEMTEFLCECGNADCTEVIALRDEEYESVRSDPLLFAVMPGHEIPDVEEILASNERFSLVRKHESEAVIARQTDPRS
ncbi:MAG: hypothetical protein ACRDOP_01390 [Gaiellaceae bacterium]